MTRNESDTKGLPESSSAGGLLKPFVVIIALTLVVWVAFWQAGQPLDGAGTAVVALVVVLAVMAIRSLFGYWRHSRSARKSE